MPELELKIQDRGEPHPREGRHGRHGLLQELCASAPDRHGAGYYAEQECSQKSDQESDQCCWVAKVKTFLLCYGIPPLKCYIEMPINDI